MLLAHLSDPHLGRKAASLGDPQGAERLHSFRQALSRLGSHSPQAILLAGDIFDSPQVERAVVQEAAHILDRVRNHQDQSIPIVVIPGNHDPADSVWVWKTFAGALGSSSTVHLVLSPQAVVLLEGRLIVEAYPCETRFSAEAPWVRRIDPGRQPANAVRVILAHGTMEGGPVPEGESDAYPFSRAEAEALQADYVALGHFHGLYPTWPAAEEIQRKVCYSGTHEPDQFGSDSGHALLVEVEAGQPARLRRLKVGKRHWRLIAIQGPADLPRADALKKEVENSDDPSRFVTRFKVDARTSLTALEIERLQGIEAGLRALGAQVERRGELLPLIDVPSLDLTALPSGAIREALHSLQEDLAGEQDPEKKARLTAAIQLGWEKLQESR